jgi:hypothetical protein
MCTQCARVRRGVQCLELQRFRKEVLDPKLLQRVVAQVAAQSARAARDRRRRHAGLWGAQDSEPIGYQVAINVTERVKEGNGVVRRLPARAQVKPREGTPPQCSRHAHTGAARLGGVGGF